MMCLGLTICFFVGLSFQSSLGFAPSASHLRRPSPSTYDSNVSHSTVEIALGPPPPSSDISHIPRRHWKISTQLSSKSPSTESQENQAAGAASSIPRPDPSILLSSKDENTQRIAVIVIAASILSGTAVFVNLLTGLENLLPYGWFDSWRDYTWPLGFGLIFIAAGISHFSFKQSFCNIVPPKGTWGGLFNVPAPGADTLGLSYKEYHTFWTGIAEAGGGLLLILSGYGFIDLPVEVPAGLLGLLVLTITPANIYMFTHDAEMGGGIPPIPYPWGHAGRGVAQMILLAMFWKLTFQ